MQSGYSWQISFFFECRIQKPENSLRRVTASEFLARKSPAELLPQDLGLRCEPKDHRGKRFRRAVCRGPILATGESASSPSQLQLRRFRHPQNSMRDPLT